MSDKTVKLLATFFYAGELPVAPGTLASFIGALIAVIFAHQWFLYILIWGIVTYLGFQVSGRMEEVLNKKDPSCIVIDEVSGVMIAFFLLPVTFPLFLTAFFLFRAFDMFKIFPVNKFEAYGGAKGVMLDDIVAGIYTFVIMQAAIRIAGII